MLIMAAGSNEDPKTGDALVRNEGRSSGLVDMGVWARSFIRRRSLVGDRVVDVRIR